LEAKGGRLDEEDHCELRMDYRLFNVDDVHSVLKEKLGHLGDDPNLILPDH
jgi:hypothetical protein